MRLSCCVNPGAGYTHSASILVVVVVVILQEMLAFKLGSVNAGLAAL
jgi:hypothetical protein